MTVFIDTPDQAYAEYIAHPTAATTGRKIHHLFMGRAVVKDGQITLLREALNVLAAAQALLPGGAADVAAPGDEIHSFSGERRRAGRSTSSSWGESPWSAARSAVASPASRLVRLGR